jgi:hypothetical protein
MGDVKTFARQPVLFTGARFTYRGGLPGASYEDSDPACTITLERCDPAGRLVIERQPEMRGYLPQHDTVSISDALAMIECGIWEPINDWEEPTE